MSTLKIGIPETHDPVISTLKEIIETREGRRGPARERAVTFQDLIDLGLMTETEADEHIAGL